MSHSPPRSARPKRPARPAASGRPDSAQASSTDAAPSAAAYEELYRSFRWHVPPRFNLGDACCARWADTDRIALIYDSADADGDASGRIQRFSYAELLRQADRLSLALRSLGVQRGDRVAVVMPQRPQTVIAHVALYRLGAVVMPMSGLFGPEALAYRYRDSEAVAAIVDAQYLEQSRQARCESLRHLIVIRDPDGQENSETGIADDGARASIALAPEIEWNALLDSVRGEERFKPVDTRAEDAAALLYTSGTTGPAKGALIAHRCLIGNLPGFVASQDWFPREGDVFWSPADWAWTGGLMDALLPTLYFGMPIVAQRGRFDPIRAFELMAAHGVTNAFLFPTALKQMMRAEPHPRQRWPLKLRAIMSGGEAVGETLFRWIRDELGVEVNEIFGQTEANYLVGGSSRRWPARPGAVGRPYPGHRITLLDESGAQVPTGQTGEIAVNRFDRHGAPDPILFLGYWNNPKATADKFSGDWCRTGDLGSFDEDGYLWYQGRADDMFKAAGYRIGPGEVENCLLSHPAVANAAVVPKPDAQRGNLVKAFVVPSPGFTPSPALVHELQEHVRGKLAPYEYPKEIEFIDALPMTPTGKVQRRQLRLLEAQRAAKTAMTGSR